MSNELYLQQLRQEYIKMGETYLSAIKSGKPSSDVRVISLSIKSVLAEIKAIEQEMKRAFA